MRWWGLWEVTRLQGWSPYEWDWHSFKRDPELFLAPFIVWGHSQKMPYTNPRGELQRHWTCYLLHHKLPTVQNKERYIFVISKPPSLCMVFSSSSLNRLRQYMNKRSYLFKTAKGYVFFLMQGDWIYFFWMTWDVKRYRMTITSIVFIVHDIYYWLCWIIVLPPWDEYFTNVAENMKSDSICSQWTYAS